ncbi:hypothetical protein AKJ56_00940 [candidate division MSBL1 archaeon SCGC-AAA382N08]|uniref:Tyr recombinase domain-containing protein n=1 Tax=candidate division MSBL1 archaeon SCGC-AAA382N08 TaxID=1698285 RepID=A0A133VQ18_9EURY|nr:hypothetical protein AKJ56_00940 [candidate division MSBL1 archaeon SCGC-AAA382N08]
MKEFEKFLFIEKGLSNVTVKNHIDSIRRIGRLSKQEAEEFIFRLYQSDYSYSHKISQVIALEYWFEHLGENVRFARQQRPRPIIKPTLSESEVTRMFLCCKNIREKTILAVLAYSGVRPKELINIKVRDVDFGSNELRVIQGKGLKDNVIYISASCTKIILEYLESYKMDNYLFMTADGFRPYNQRALRKLVKIVSKRAKLNRRIYPYLFRHSLATNMINRGADIITVKNQMRHCYAETTMLYIHSLGYSSRNSYEKIVPSYY